MEDMPSETISKIHLVDLAGRFVIHWFTFSPAVFVTLTSQSVPWNTNTSVTKGTFKIIFSVVFFEFGSKISMQQKEPVINSLDDK